MKASTRAVVTGAEGTRRAQTSAKYKWQDLGKESVHEIRVAVKSVPIWRVSALDYHINNGTSTEKRKFKKKNQFGREDDDFNFLSGEFR